jgi:hypothetical protein
MADYVSPLLEALAGRQKDIYAESPWLQGAAQTANTVKFQNPNASIGKNILAAALMGAVSGGMKGVGDIAAAGDMREALGQFNKAQNWEELAQNPKWAKYAPNVMASQFLADSQAREWAREDQRELTRDQRRYRQDLAKMGEEYGYKMQYEPALAAAKTAEEYRLKMMYEPSLAAAQAQAQANATLAGPKYVGDQEDEAYKRIANSQPYKDLSLVAPYYQTMKKLLPENTKAADLGIIYAFSRMNDPGSTVREGEVKLSEGAAGWLQSLINGANAELSGTGRLSPTTRKQLLNTAEIKYNEFQRNYDDTAVQIGNIAMQRSRGQAKPDRFLPLPIQTQPVTSGSVTMPQQPTAGPMPGAAPNFTGWATNKAGQQVYFKNGKAQ